ncbi:MAG: hypothetical protein ATN36_05670 [Epulopiscium sp. Nele67-Bin005]|nr:MAG: hypothetical protein ATN36_05670 [Epulopiscium sp. Nele67-Bin005]
MIETSKQNLKQLFDKEIIDTYKCIIKDVKYKCPTLLTQINKYGGYEAVIKYIGTDANTVDFGVLWEAQRLDLTVEALITDEKFRNIFPEEIVSFCENRLNDYNYAPHIIVEPPKPKEIDITPGSFLKTQNITTLEIPNEPKKEPEKVLPSHNYHITEVNISVEEWSELFLNQKIFTAKNQDMLLRMYLAGGRAIRNTDLCGEEGYSTKYPYKEVIMSLGKRIKMNTKIEIPKSSKGEMLWWNVICVGWFESNQSFELSLAPKLFAAIKNCVDNNKIDISDVSINMNKEIIANQAKHINELISVKEGLTKEVTPATIVEHIQPEVDEHLQTNITENEPPKRPRIDKNLSQEEQLEILLNGLFDEPIEVEEPSPKVVTPVVENNVEPIIKEKVTSVIDKKVEPIIKEKVTPVIDKKVEPIIKENITPVVDKKVEPIIKEKVIEKTAPIAEKSKVVAETPSTILEKQSATTKEPEAKVEDMNATENKWKELKEQCLDYYGAICEVCGIDYGYTYGEKFDKLIDVHNLKIKNNKNNCDLSKINPEEDLVPICHNCHFIMKSKTPFYTLDEMKQLIKQQ